MLEVLFCILAGFSVIVTAFCTLIGVAVKILYPLATAIATFIFKLFGLM